MEALRPAEYQLVALTKLLLNGYRGLLICDGVGVGKTISAGYIITYLSGATGTPALVVCPPILVDKWRLELGQKFGIAGIPIRSEDELGTAVEQWTATGRNAPTYILTSSMLQRVPIPPFRGPVIFDEIHHYRNSSTRSYASAKALAASSTYRIGLSATPVNNRIDDLATELSLLLDLSPYLMAVMLQDLWRPHRRAQLYPLMTRFLKEFLGIHFARRKVVDHDVVLPSEYLDEVQQLVKSVRRRKGNEEVKRDEITFYRLAASSAAAFGESLGADVREPTAKRAELHRVLALHPREQVLVFCEFARTAHDLAEETASRPCLVITGDVPMWERMERMRAFRASPDAVLVMTAVGSEGLDLQFCSTVVNYDLNWNPMVLEQRIGRIDRVGQAKSEIAIHNFVVRDSIDERILKVLGKKLGLLQGTMLEAGTILESATSNHGHLYSEEAIGSELEAARELGSALELTNAILPDDYYVLGDMKSEFCDPVRLREAARAAPGVPLWIEARESAESWQGEIVAASKELMRTVASFSA